MSEAVLTERQKQSAATRARLVDVAASLFAERGYQSTSVDRIVEKAKVAKGTFFVHFKSKDAVVAELVKIQATTARAKRQRVLDEGGTALDAACATVMSLGKQASMSRSLSRAVLSATLVSREAYGPGSAAFEEILTDLEADAKAAKRAGLLSKAVDAQTFAQTMMTAYLGAVMHFASDERVETANEVLGRVIDAHLAATLTDPTWRRQR